MIFHWNISLVRRLVLRRRRIFVFLLNNERDISFWEPVSQNTRELPISYCQVNQRFALSLQNRTFANRLVLLNIVFEKTDSDERNHTKQFRQSVAINQNVKIGPGYFAIGFPRGQLLILIPVRGRLYRRPKSLIKDHLLIKRRRKVADLAKLPLDAV